MCPRLAMRCSTSAAATRLMQRLLALTWAAGLPGTTSRCVMHLLLLQCWVFMRRLSGPFGTTGAHKPLLLHVALSGSTHPAHNLQQPAQDTSGCRCLLTCKPAWHSKGWLQG